MKKLNYIFVIFLSFVAQNSFAGSLDSALETSASAMKAQSARIKVVTENIANEDTIGTDPNQEPYRRKTIYFEQVKNPRTGANLVKVKRIGTDNSGFKLVYLPNHPAANADGYVRIPNVDKSLEAMDLRDAQRSYEANISAIETTKQIQERTLDLMR